MNEQVKLCPYCGKEPQGKICHNYGTTPHDEMLYFCVNPDCPNYLCVATTLEEWNNRPDEDRLNARISELENNSVQIHYINGDVLPRPISYKVYSAMFRCSKVDFVRLFPYVMVNGQQLFLIKLPEVKE